MDRVRRFIQDSLDRLGISLADCSRRIKKNPAYMHQYLDRGSPKQLDEDTRKKVASIIGCDERMLIPDQPPPVESIPWDAPAHQPLRGRTGVRDLPLWPASTQGEVAAGDLDIPVAYIARIEALLGNASAWACRVTDSGLEPCLSIGDTAFFDPADPARPLDLVCLVRALPDQRGVERRLGVCRQLDRRRVMLSGCVGDSSGEEIVLEPHMRVVRMVAMHRS